MKTAIVIVRSLFKRVRKALPVLMMLLNLVATGYVFYLNQQLSADVAGTLTQAEKLYADTVELQVAASRQDGGTSVAVRDGAFSVPADGPRIIYIDETPYSVHTDIHDWMLLNFESKELEAEIVSYIQYKGLFLVSVVCQTGESTAELWIVPYIWDAAIEDYVRGEPWMYFDSEVVADFVEQQSDGGE